MFLLIIHLKITGMEGDGVKIFRLFTQSELLHDPVDAHVKAKEPADKHIKRKCCKDPSQHRTSRCEIDRSESGDQHAQDNVAPQIRVVSQHMKLHIIAILPLGQSAFYPDVSHFRQTLRFPEADFQRSGRLML